MLPMSSDEREQWKHTRARGVYRYVVQTGVIGWGGGVLLFTMAVLRFIEPADYFARLVLGRPVELILALGGLCFGIIMWACNEHRFKTGGSGTQA